MPGLDLQERSEDAAKDAVHSLSMSEKKPLESHKVRDPGQGTTFAAQDNLPRLPIPELEETCMRYLDALAPLQSLKEHNDTAAAVRDFLRYDGQYLQERLMQYAEDKSSYIEQFWYDSYLNSDNPVVLNLNPFFLLEDDPTPARNNQVNRAASLVVSSLSFVRAVRREELPPDTVRGRPLCMYQHSRLFGTARIPTESGCQIVQDPHSRHIVILCKGQFYWFDVFDEKSDLILSEKDLAQNLQVIVEDAQATPIQEAAKGALGVLSTENRKVWSGLRDVISRDECSNNSECLSIVDTALFVLCLDSTEPRNPSELCMTMLCGSNKVEKGIQIGTCTNRWYDKLQLIVCKNGSAGINFEHTGVDGHTVLRFASDVYTDTILRFARTINGQAPSLWASDSPDPAKRDRSTYDHSSTTPHKLEWDMIPELRTALRFAETRLADLIQQNEFQTLEFMTYGKNFITKNGFSPDAFVQMAFQAAYYGLYGRLESVYEPAMTKIYLHGRTEAIRSVTAESAEFVRTFWENKAARQKIEALRKACRKHTEISKLCGKAQGQDRHLYALYCIWQRAAAAPSDCFVSTNSTPNKSHVNGDNGNNKARSSPSPHISPLASPSSPSSRPKATTTTSDNVVCAPDSPVRSTHHAMPALFADSGWDTLNSTILSTSNCGNPSLRQFGFGPTSGNGFGIGYIIKDGSVSICASSKHRQTRRYVDAIESYLLEVRRLLRQLEREVADSSFKKEGTGEDVVTVNINGEGGCKGQRKVGRRLSRGRIVGSEVGKSEAVAATASNLTATAQMTRQKYGMDDGEEVEEHDFGGYGFFDSGLLAYSLHSSQQNQSAEHDRQHSGKTRTKGDIGKRLRINEY